MCGIAGLLDLGGAPAPAVVAQRMATAMAHRGPDGEGTWAEGPLALGHRRLAILDLSPAGQQPMLSRDGRYVLAYNGEIYNFRELRAELQARGHVFHSRTDTEVVLEGFAAWGPGVFERLNGMFALAIWDTRERRLTLARDRYGIKPLYWTKVGNTLAFASESKAFRAVPGFQARLDAPALLEYFTFQNLFTERTLLAGVSLLPAGTWWQLAPGQEPGRPVRYWDFHFREPEPGKARTDAEYAAELDWLMRQAVQRQLVSDVDVGSYLSGGMDSGTITALAAPALPYLKTFTCGFDLHSASGMELNFDERAKAELMSYVFRTEHYEMVLKAGDMERAMAKLAWHLEEPRVGQSYPNYYAAQLASRFVKVVLSGAGGDELFGGYPWRYYRAVVNADFESYVDKYYAYWQRLVPNRDLKAMFAPVEADVRGVWTRDIFRDVFVGHENTLTTPEEYVNHSMYFEAKTFLHGLLVVEDKLSMAHSLETRVPFLDNDLVDFAMELPVRLKLSRLDEVVRVDENELAKYFQRTKDGKVLLRQVMASLLPAEVAQAEKQGFSAPDSSWFKGESIDYVRRELLDPKARLYDYLDYGTVRGLVEEHLSGQKNRRLLVWSFLNVEHWLREYVPS